MLQIIDAAKQSDSTVVLGGPESANYSAEYLHAGADVIVVGNAIEKDDSLIIEMAAAVHSVPVRI